MSKRVDSAVIDHSSSLKFNYRILFSFCLMKAGSAEEAGKWDTYYDAFMSRPTARALELLLLLLILLLLLWVLMAIGKPVYRCIAAIYWTGVWSSTLTAKEPPTIFSLLFHFVYCKLHLFFLKTLDFDPWSRVPHHKREVIFLYFDLPVQIHHH